MFEFTLTALIYILLVTYWYLRQVAHKRHLQHYKVRIHVNGIRGKSTVTRLIAGVLREAGYRTVAKTTGSAAVTIDLDGHDIPIKRRGGANVREQVDIIAGWEPLGAEAMVIECMALHPKYQEWTEKMVLQAHISVITNVREDHQDVMGETLPEIAVSLAHMCPQNGYLLTAEYNPELQTILQAEAERRGSHLIVADATRVHDGELAQFDYLSFKDNLALGLSVADLLGIDRATAMRGMIKSKPDIGVVRLQPVQIRGKAVTWANLFAVNDRESMIISMQVLEKHCDDQTIKIGILNNRYDRERRAEQFGDVAVKDLSFDYLITFGAFEDLVTRKLISNGFPQKNIVNLGFNVNPSLDRILDEIAAMIPEGGHGMLVGFVNIHTPQAEMMMEYFESLETHQAQTSLVEKDIGYTTRQRFEMAHGGLM
jgi:poly-gamma-glutamate synthase PgsB/CapB